MRGTCWAGGGSGGCGEYSGVYDNSNVRLRLANFGQFKADRHPVTSKDRWWCSWGQGCSSLLIHLPTSLGVQHGAGSCANSCCWI